MIKLSLSTAWFVKSWILKYFALIFFMQSNESATAEFSPKKWRAWVEKAIEIVLLLAALSCIGITLSIVGILLYESWGFFQQVPLLRFLTDEMWTPGTEQYGVRALVSGTLVTTMVALLVAIPVGTIAAIYLSEFAKPAVREVAKPLLELLASIPTVVYGYFAYLFVSPVLQAMIPGLGGFSMLSAGLVMGIMIIPYISSVSEDAMRAVPVYLREGSFAMGATRLQTTLNVVLPASISGITAAYILGISRAIGETMVVAIAAGGQPIFTLNPLEPALTITAYIVQMCLGDVPHGSLEYQTIFAVGLTLVLMTLIFNIIGHFLKKKYREAY
jgi:phosphate transport system permease protein